MTDENAVMMTVSGIDAYWFCLAGVTSYMLVRCDQCENWFGIQKATRTVDGQRYRVNGATCAECHPSGQNAMRGCRDYLNEIPEVKP